MGRADRVHTAGSVTASLEPRTGDARVVAALSDGLATLSVYIEKVKSEAEAFLGLSSMGAMNAFGAVIDGYQVTVVGEVPPATVQMVAASVQQAASDS